MKTITPKQNAVLDFIKSYFASNQRTPTLAEINAQFGYKSWNSAHQHLVALCKKKHIHVFPNVPRGIRVLESA